MKRCPQCEFIYEDDQSLCDMDGVLLVFDARTLPNMHALATVSAPIADKPQRRSRMVPAFATLILMLGIPSVYYVTALRSSSVADNLAPATVTTAPAQPAAAEVPATIPEPTPATVESNPVQAPAPEPAVEQKRETHSTTAPKP